VVVHVGTVIDSVWQAEVAETSQSPQLLVTTTPELSTAVAHQGVGESVYVHWKWVTPLYKKGNTHVPPVNVEQEFGTR